MAPLMIYLWPPLLTFCASPFLIKFDFYNHQSLETGLVMMDADLAAKCKGYLLVFSHDFSPSFEVFSSSSIF